MNILFRSLDGNRSDYITDGILVGLRQLGHKVMDVPLRESIYKNKPNWYSVRGLWHFGHNEKTKDVVSFKNIDLIICDSASINTVEEKSIIYLMTNDPITRQPYPDVFVPKPMAIKESYMYDRKNINDFELHHTVDKDDCVYTEPEKKQGVFVSFLNMSNLREEVAKEFGNIRYTNKKDYYDAISNEGTDCQRDAEVAGNTLLCIARHPKRKYDEASYKDMVNCIEFSSVEELKAKMKLCDDIPELYERLLKACYKHTIEFRTHDAQARRLIEWKILN
jgi:hypothetical protein